MKLINFPGLNCYSNGIVSVAHALGIDYSAAFSGLWSETDFFYQPHREVYLSKRLPDALEALGVKLVVQLCDTPEQAGERLSQLEEGELIILGMDAFHVPWSQFYKAFHGPHFFVARYTKGDSFPCYDPTFGMAAVQLPRESILAHAYDISRILPGVKNPPPASSLPPSLGRGQGVGCTEKRPPQTDALSDAAEVLRVHPDTRQRVLAQMDQAAAGDGEDIVRLAKYMDALKNNRYLYRYYLERLPAPYHQKHLLLSEDIFSDWAALKNGLNKAAITKRDSVFREIQNLFEGLIEEELRIARQMLG